MSEHRNWRQGVHTSAVGRFAGMYDVIQSRAGLGCWTAEELSIIVDDERRGHGRPLFQYLPERACAPHVSANSTVRTIELRYVEDGKEKTEAVIRDSTAWPARLVVSNENRFRLYGELLWAAWPVFPTRDGLRGSHSRMSFAIGSRENDDYAYLRERDGALLEPWMLLPCAGGEMDRLVQLVFQRNPTAVLQAGWAWEFRFDGPAGGIAIFPPFGIRKTPQQILWGFNGLGFRAWDDIEASPHRHFKDALAKVRQWAPRLLSFPVNIRDEYCFEGESCLIRQRGEFLDLTPNDWNMKPQRHIPVPPVFSRLLESDVDRQIAIEPAPESDTLETRVYLQRFVRGEEWTARLPREHWVSHTWAPLRVANDERTRKLDARMAGYLAEPNLTFHGDCTWEKTNVQDCFANYRANAPAAWASDEATRQKLWAAIEGGVANLKPDQFAEKIEPLSKVRWLGQRHIWSRQYNTVDYDWYIGQLAAGVWCKWYYEGRDRAWLEKVMPILEGQFAHYRAHIDWTLCTGWCDIFRKNRWIDGFFYASHGMVAMARLARELGRIELAEEAEYYLLLHVAFWDAIMHCGDYAVKLGAKSDWMPEGCAEEDLMVGGVYDRENFGVAISSKAHFGGCFVGVDTPEHMIAALSRPRLAEQFRRMMRQTMPKCRPDWNREYTRDGAGAGPLKKHVLDPSHSLFYCVYDYLALEALFCGASLEKLISLVNIDELAADMLMLYLQATHPKVMAPANAEFDGCVWDEAAKTLHVRLKRLPGVEPDPIVLIAEAAPREVRGAREVANRVMPIGAAYALESGVEEACFSFA